MDAASLFWIFKDTYKIQVEVSIYFIKIKIFDRGGGGVIKNLTSGHVK